MPGPFRADHVGSLLRPRPLRDARVAYTAGTLAREALTAAEDAAIVDAVDRQQMIGLRAVTDGEFRRDWWHLDFLSQLDGVGLEASAGLKAMKFAGVEEMPPTPVITGPIRYARPIMIDHFAFLKKNSAKAAQAVAKFTIPSPSMLHLRGGSNDIPAAIYPDREQYWSDLANAYAQAIAALADAGCTYLQIDDVTFAYLSDEKVRNLARDKGDDPDELHRRYAATINAALANRPPDMTIAMHTCRGNFQSTWVADKPYAREATESMFSCNVDAFFMEFDSERAGGFEVLRLLPPSKTVVLGLVTTKLGALESSDDLQRRINEAAKVVPLDRLCLSPQCGFSSTHHGNHLDESEQWRKLERVVAVARDVWGEG